MKPGELYTHILFDHDGVLVNTEPLYYRATKSKLAELGVELTFGAYMRIQADGADAWQLARDNGSGDEEITAQRKQRNRYYQALLSSENIDIPGVEPTLATLAETCKLAIVTTARQEDFELIHTQRQIVQHMEFVLTNKRLSS